MHLHLDLLMDKQNILNGVDISKLATVSGDLTLGHYGDIDLSQFSFC